MSFFSILPVIVPLLGAVGTLALSRVPGVHRYARFVAPVASVLVVLSLLPPLWVAFQPAVPSLWRPSFLFGALPVLQAEPATTMLALVFAVAVAATLLVETGRSGEASVTLVAATLALVAPTVAVLWSANVLTLIVCWAAFDLLYAAARFAAGAPGRAVVRGLALGHLATLLIWGGTLLAEGDGALTRFWSLMAANRAQLTFWALAGTIRLALYPVHLSLPDELDPRRTSAIVPLLMQPLLGWGLWLRILSVNRGFVPDFAWLPLCAALTIALGGVLAWTRESPYRLVPWAGMAVNGVLLLASSLAGRRASDVIVAGSVAWVLGTLALGLSAGYDRKRWWWSVPTLVGALAFAGLPLTLGFVAQSMLLSGLMGGARLGPAICLFVGFLFLLPALARLLLAAPLRPPPEGVWPRIAQGVGTGIPAVWLALAGLAPRAAAAGTQPFTLAECFAAPTLAGWLLWLICLALGALLVWQEGSLRPRLAFLLAAIHDLLRLEWLYNALAGAVDRGLGVLRVADEVVGGAGALLWSWVLFMALLLVVGS